MSTVRYLHPDGEHKFPAELWPLPAWRDKRFARNELPAKVKVRWTLTYKAMLASASGKDPMIPNCFKPVTWKAGGLSGDKQEKVKDLIEDYGLKAAVIQVAAEDQASQEYGDNWRDKLDTISYNQIGNWIGSEENLPDWAPVSIRNDYMKKFLAWQDRAYYAEDLDGKVKIGWVDVSRSKMKDGEQNRAETYSKHPTSLGTKRERSLTPSSDSCDSSDLSDCPWQPSDDEDDEYQRQDSRAGAQSIPNPQKRHKAGDAMAPRQDGALDICRATPRSEQPVPTTKEQLSRVPGNSAHPLLCKPIDPDDAPLAWGHFSHVKMPGSFADADPTPAVDTGPQNPRDLGTGHGRAAERIQDISGGATPLDSVVPRDEPRNAGTGPLGLGVAGCLGIFFLGQVAGRWLG